MEWLRRILTLPPEKTVGLNPMVKFDPQYRIRFMLKTNLQNRQMKNKVAVTGAILTLAALSAVGADNANGDQSLKYDCYRAHELSLDGFGTGSLGKYTIDHLSGARIRENSDFGAGLGVNYFFTRNLGLGVEAYSENTTREFIDSASANLTLRLPLGQSGFAPYIFGGGGHQFDMLQAWFGQAGGGVEYRFTPNVGLFTDARMVLPDKASYYGVARLGVRFAF